jgi:hypothetical protein
MAIAGLALLRQKICQNIGIGNAKNQDGEHDNASCLLIQQKSSSLQYRIIDSMPKLIFVCFCVLKLQLSIATGYEYLSIY